MIEGLHRIGILESLLEALITAYALRHGGIEGDYGLLEPALAPAQRRPCPQRQLDRRPPCKLVVSRLNLH